MRRKLLLAVLLATLAVLPGCRGDAAGRPPAGSAGGDYIERSAQYLEEFQQGQFDGFYQAVSAEFSRQVPKETFAAQWAAVSQAVGRQEEVLSREQQEKEGYQVVTITAQYTLRRVVSTFSFDREDRVAGVFTSFLPLEVVAEATDAWREEPVEVGTGEKRLHGLLTLPAGVENPPVVLLLQGSGPSDLNEKIGVGGNRPFYDLAHGLAEQGIASLRYNKRSYEYPEDCAAAGIEAEYLADARAAFSLLSADRRVDGSRIYLLGHSEGGMLGPEIVRQNPECRGFLSLAGSLRPLADILLEQAQRQLDGQPSLTAEQREAALEPYRQGVEQIKALDPADASTMILGAPAVYWNSLNALDLPALAAELTVPVLVLQGEEDFQVPAATDLPLWREALAGNPDADFRLYPGLSHLFMPGGSADVIDLSVYDLPAQVEPQVISDIAAWIRSH